MYHIKFTESGDFQVGDLMWAKVGSHPYWPCMITAEPETDIFTKKGNITINYNEN